MQRYEEPASSSARFHPEDLRILSHCGSLPMQQITIPALCGLQCRLALNHAHAHLRQGATGSNERAGRRFLGAICLPTMRVKCNIVIAGLCTGKGHCGTSEIVVGRPGEISRRSAVPESSIGKPTPDLIMRCVDDIQPFAGGRCL